MVLIALVLPWIVVSVSSCGITHTLNLSGLDIMQGTYQGTNRLSALFGTAIPSNVYTALQMLAASLAAVAIGGVLSLIGTWAGLILSALGTVGFTLLVLAAYSNVSASLAQLGRSGAVSIQGAFGVGFFIAVAGLMVGVVGRTMLEPRATLGPGSAESKISETHAQVAAATPPDSTRRFCSQCGASVPPEARFCSACGASLAPPT